MPRRRSSNKGPLKAVNQPSDKPQNKKTADVAPQVSQKPTNGSVGTLQTRSIDKISTLIEEHDLLKPGTSSNTDGLYDELDSFRLRWKRELDAKLNSVDPQKHADQSASGGDVRTKLKDANKSNHTNQPHVQDQENQDPSKNREPDSEKSSQTYAKAKKLFLQAVELERDDMHHESIRYYKEAMHLCPNIERQIFQEQTEASARELERQQLAAKNQPQDEPQEEIHSTSLYDRIREIYCDESSDDRFAYCKPSNKWRDGTLHLSDLPQELIMHIFYHIVGQELDLTSLENAGLVCRGFFLLSRDPSLWRSICYVSWGEKIYDHPSVKARITLKKETLSPSAPLQVDWRRMYLERLRINFDGIYISRTKYIRQGDTGFQDITYRPFHVIRYYRYVRFFPDKRVIILTTNEEPDKIVPIFRHALNATQFSPELSTLEGNYEFVNENQVNIVAEKDCNAAKNNLSFRTQRRQSHQQFNNWSRQTPLSQKFNMKFELMEPESGSSRNNILRWRDYTILSRLEFGQEITNFDLAPDTFPSLQFHRVRICNMKSTKPLAAH